VNTSYRQYSLGMGTSFCHSSLEMLEQPTQRLTADAILAVEMVH
jgi:hypothetical protein